MDAIELMLTGEMDMPRFIALLKSNQNVQKAVNNLIPFDAIENPKHDFWKCISYDSLKKKNFNFIQFLNWLCKFNGSLGDNLNLFDAIRRAYTFTFSDMICTRMYDDAYDLFLDAVRDCYDGPEVNRLVKQIIQDALLFNTKKKRIEKAKKEIQLQFHTVNAKKPRWIQGPEWPMGSNSPMRFVSQKRQGEMVQYLFEDSDTNESRIIEQFY